MLFVTHDSSYDQYLQLQKNPFFRRWAENWAKIIFAFPPPFVEKRRVIWNGEIVKYVKWCKLCSPGKFWWKGKANYREHMPIVSMNNTMSSQKAVAGWINTGCFRSEWSCEALQNVGTVKGVENTIPSENLHSVYKWQNFQNPNLYQRKIQFKHDNNRTS